ncbi:MAG: peptidoglycan editing factor PgeF [Aquificaceae bacterium]
MRFKNRTEIQNLIYSLKFKNFRFGIELWKEQGFAPIQVHSNKVLRVAPGDLPKECDAIYTLEPGFKIGVKTADCVPLLLAGNSVVCAIHAGWRGLKAGIIERAIQELSGFCNPEEIIAFIGPSALSCCYEVGKEFSQSFSELETREGKLYMDTQKEAISRLIKSGIERFHVVRVCTICNLKLPSYRRDNSKERLYSWIMMEGDGG